MRRPGWLVTGGADGLVRIWDTATATAGPGGGWIASTGRDESIRIWNTRTGEPAAMMRIDAPALCCASTPDGRSLFVGGLASLYCFAFRH